MASIKLKGDTSGEVTISAPSVAGTTTLELPATSSTLATQNALGVRNLIINGDMRIAQRGTVAVTSGGGETYTLDRYALLNYWGSGQVTVSSSTDAPTGHSNSIGLTVNTSAPLNGATGYYCSLFQCIEGYNAQHAYNQNVTISFWVKSSITGTYSITLTNDKNSSFSSTTRAYVAEYTINTADTWEQKTITVDLSSGTSSGTWNTTNGTGLCLAFNLGGESNRQGDAYLDTWGTIGSTYDMQSADQVNWLSTTGATFNVSQLQLEVGDTATPFEHRPYDMELQRCLRYCYQQTFTDNYENIVAVACYSGSASFGVIRYPVIMRTPPTFSYGGVIEQFGVFHSGAGRYLTSFSPNEISTSTMQLGCVASGFTGGHAGWLRLYNIAVNGSQYIRFDAEL